MSKANLPKANISARLKNDAAKKVNTDELWVKRPSKLQPGHSVWINTITGATRNCTEQDNAAAADPSGSKSAVGRMLSFSKFKPKTPAGDRLKRLQHELKKENDSKCGKKKLSLGKSANFSSSIESTSIFLNGFVSTDETAAFNTETTNTSQRQITTQQLQAPKVPEQVDEAVAVLGKNARFPPLKSATNIRQITTQQLQTPKVPAQVVELATAPTINSIGKIVPLPPLKPARNVRQISTLKLQAPKVPERVDEAADVPVKNVSFSPLKSAANVRQIPTRQLQTPKVPEQVVEVAAGPTLSSIAKNARLPPLKAATRKLQKPTPPLQAPLLPVTKKAAKKRKHEEPVVQQTKKQVLEQKQLNKDDTKPGMLKNVCCNIKNFFGKFTRTTKQNAQDDKELEPEPASKVAKKTLLTAAAVPETDNTNVVAPTTSTTLAAASATITSPLSMQYDWRNRDSFSASTPKSKSPISSPRQAANNRLNNLRESLKATNFEPTLPLKQTPTKNAENAEELEMMDWEPIVDKASNTEIKTDPAPVALPKLCHKNLYSPTKKSLSRLLDEQKDKDMQQKYLKDHVYFVLDTNILLQCLGIIKELTETKFKGVKGLVIFLPYRVLQELDNLKMRGKTAALKKDAITAIRYINNAFNEGVVSLKSQSAEEETEHIISVETADDSILNCCLQVKKHVKHVFLLSMDINLRNKAHSTGVDAKTKDDLNSLIDAEHTKPWYERMKDKNCLKF